MPFIIKLMLKFLYIFCCMQVNIIRIFQQLNFFQQYQQRLSQVIGKEEAKRVVKESLVLITLGGNDFVNNYYLVPYSIRSQQYSLEDYVPYVIAEYKKVLQVSLIDHITIERSWIWIPLKYSTCT